MKGVPSRAFPALNMIKAEDIQDRSHEEVVVSSESLGQASASSNMPLIDLSGDTPLGGEEEDDSGHQVNFRHIESLYSIKNTNLPLYSMACNGKMIEVSLDSGATCSYVAPQLAAGCPVRSVSDREVETAGGHKFAINRAVTLSLDAAGLEHEVSAYVLDTKFDLILGRDWIKRIKPVPDWDRDTWKITVGTTVYILRPKFDRPLSDLAYLISHKQVAKMTKRQKLTSCFCVLCVLMTKERSNPSKTNSNS